MRRAGSSGRGVAAAALGVVMVLGGGCATTGGSMAPSAVIWDTLSPGWEYKFKLQWNVAPDAGGTRRVDGYLYNEYGSRYVIRLQLLALDPAGNVVARQIKQLPGEVPAFGRDYFEFWNVPAADQYRVTVFSYDPAESGGEQKVR
jgi:hypothetical protein